VKTRLPLRTATLVQIDVADSLSHERLDAAVVTDPAAARSGVTATASYARNVTYKTRTAAWNKKTSSPIVGSTRWTSNAATHWRSPLANA